MSEEKPNNDTTGDNVIVENDTGDVTDWNIEGGGGLMYAEATGEIPPGQSLTLTLETKPTGIKFSQSAVGTRTISITPVIVPPAGGGVLRLVLTRVQGSLTTLAIERFVDPPGGV